MRKNNKDKKVTRNDFRIEDIHSNLLRQFNLTPKKHSIENVNSLTDKLRKPSAFLYLCVLTGISVGIGSAFANWDMTQKPLDQKPIQKIEEKQIAKEHPFQKEEPTTQNKQEIQPKTTQIEASSTEQGKDDLQRNGNVQASDKQPSAAVSTPTIQERKYRTEVGGQLPNTSGNDLNVVILGILVILTGILFKKRLKWIHNT